jgi:hypothetical protein
MIVFFIVRVLVMLSSTDFMYRISNKIEKKHTHAHKKTSLAYSQDRNRAIRSDLKQGERYGAREDPTFSLQNAAQNERRKE